MTASSSVRVARWPGADPLGLPYKPGPMQTPAPGALTDSMRRFVLSASILTFVAGP